jgi:hypothetical protein
MRLCAITGYSRTSRILQGGRCAEGVPLFSLIQGLANHGCSLRGQIRFAARRAATCLFSPRLPLLSRPLKRAQASASMLTHAGGLRRSPRINITNYDRIHKFDASQFGAVVLDESSVIKHHAAKTLQTLLDKFRATPYKLACTATPAPNDWTELGNHAEFLGVRSRAEMLAEFFVHDGGDTQTWRLKGHARKLFWRWVASWGAMVRSPADLGHDASAYELPPLHVHQHTVEIAHNAEHGLFAMEAQTLTERRNARKESLVDRVRACAEIVNSTDEIWLIWCDLNAEGDALEAAIPGSVQIAGRDDERIQRAQLASTSQHGKTRVLISKPSICGFGLNFQACCTHGVCRSY